MIFLSIPVPGSRGKKGTGSATLLSVPFVVLGVLPSENSHQNFVQNHHILPVYLLHVVFEEKKKNFTFTFATEGQPSIGGARTRAVPGLTSLKNRF